MQEIIVKEMKPKYSVTLHRVNKEIIADLDDNFIERVTRDINGIDTIEVIVPKYVTDRNGLSKKRFITYDEIDYERYLSLDEEEFFVIKEITEKGKGENKTKRATGFALEKKLVGNDIEVEDVGFCLMTGEADGEILSLNDYMYEQTGWRFGHIDDSVLYDTLDNGERQEKLRWQESVNTNWHDFLTNNVREEFECIVIFDTKNKLVNLYDIDSFGDEIVLSLGYDDYLRDLEKKGSTENLVTRLTLVGNEDIDILEETPTGYPYIEDYSYFIEKGDMSQRLEDALKKYDEMVKKRTQTWKELIAQKAEKQTELNKKKQEMLILVNEINALKGIINAYSLANDVENKALKMDELTKKQDEFVVLNNLITNLEHEVIALQESIININILCKRETCTDDNGGLIFSQELLDELKEFIYCDTYNNDSFLNVSDLIKAGERQLESRSRPTSVWSVDSVDFMKRVLGVRYNTQVNFNIGLGNMIELCSDEDDIDVVYFTGFTQDFKAGTLTLNLNNKKIVDSDIRVIGDKLHKAERATRSIMKNRYLWVQQKKNRINLEYEKGR